MITTDAPAWLRRSDQAVTWARTMLTRSANRWIDRSPTRHRHGWELCNDGYQNLRNSTRMKLLR